MARMLATAGRKVNEKRRRAPRSATRYHHV